MHAIIGDSRPAFIDLGWRGSSHLSASNGTVAYKVPGQLSRIVFDRYSLTILKDWNAIDRFERGDTLELINVLRPLSRITAQECSLLTVILDL